MPASGLYIVAWEGEKIGKMRRAWHTARKLAGLGPDVTPHVLRHTAATWMMQAGVARSDIAGYLASRKGGE